MPLNGYFKMHEENLSELCCFVICINEHLSAFNYDNEYQTITVLDRTTAL